MRSKKKPKRLGTVVEVENAKKERRQRVIDLSQYNIGFEAVVDKQSRPKPPSSGNAVGVQYSRYLTKFDKGDINKFSTRDMMFFFRDTANENGVKYITGNPKVEMRNFKLALDRGYTNEEILSMIEFLFTSGQQYLDLHALHPGILLTGWCNRIYQDTKLWLDDKYNPNKTYNNSKPKLNREWSDDNTDIKSNVGEW